MNARNALNFVAVWARQFEAKVNPDSKSFTRSS
jgi:hypothetical protein